MSTPNDDALRCAGELGGYGGRNPELVKARSADHLRRLVAENTAQRELLRQAVGAIEDLADAGAEAWGKARPCVHYAIEIENAINEHLKEQP